MPRVARRRNLLPLARPDFSLSWVLKALALSAIASFAAEKEAQPPVVISESAWSATIFGTGVKINDQYTDGNVFLTVPVWSTIGRNGTLGGDYVFVEPYASLGSHG